MLAGVNDPIAFLSRSGTDWMIQVAVARRAQELQVDPSRRRTHVPGEEPRDFRRQSGGRDRQQGRRGGPQGSSIGVLDGDELRVERRYHASRSSGEPPSWPACGKPPLPSPTTTRRCAAGAAASAEAAAGQDAFYTTGSKSLAQYKAEQEAATAAQSASVVALGKRATFALGAAAAAITYEGLKIHSSFQSAMTRVSTLAGVTQSRLAELTAGIKALAPQVDQGLTPLANALYRIASTPAGLKATNAQLLTMTKYAGMLTTIGECRDNIDTDVPDHRRGDVDQGIKGAESPKHRLPGRGDRWLRRHQDVGLRQLHGNRRPYVGKARPASRCRRLLLSWRSPESNLQSGQVSGHGLAHGLQLMAAPTPTARDRSWGPSGWARRHSPTSCGPRASAQPSRRCTPTCRRPFGTKGTPTARGFPQPSRSTASRQADRPGAVGRLGEDGDRQDTAEPPSDPDARRRQDGHPARPAGHRVEEGLQPPSTG